MQKLLTVSEASEVLNLPQSTLNRWRSQGEGPPFGKLGRRVFYRADQLELWADQQFTAHGPSAA